MTLPEANKQLRLLWVNHFAVAPDMGGATRHVEVGRELVKLGWHVTIVASDFHLHRRTYTRRSGANDRAPVREMIDGVEVEWLWASPYSGNDARRVANWLSFSRSLARFDTGALSPDIIIGSTPHLFAALASWRLARKHRIPFMLEVRDLWPESLGVGGGRRGPGYWGLWTLSRFLYRVADRILVLARGVGRFLTSQGVAAHKVVYVPNGTDVSRFAAPGAQPARESLRLVYAGAHGPANGLDTVLDAALALRDEPRVSFLFIGDGTAKAELEGRARASALTNVEFAESVPKSGMPSVLASCDAGLMVLKDVPLFSFGVSPNKLFDYWGASLPVVCNVPGEVAEWVRTAGGGMQTANASASALVATIRDLLLLSPGDRRALGASGRGFVEREHDRPVLAARLDEALRECMQAVA